MLEVIDITAGYGEVRVLDRVSLQVTDGITCVIGPNGAGKSTLLKTIFGLTNITAGRVVFRSQEITGRSPLAIRRMGISYVAQGRWNFPHMTVLENLDMGAYTRADPAVAGDVADILRRFPALGAYRTERAGNLSGGLQRILEMAMGLLARPRLVLLDEPSMGLAPQMVDEVFRAIQEIGGMGVAVLMVEQNAWRALRISRRALVLDLGVKVLEGPAAEIMADPQLQEAYLGEADGR